MAATTRQQLDLVSRAAQVAGDAEAALSAMLTFLRSVNLSAHAAGIPTADWGTPASGALQGFDPAVWTNFLAAAQAVAQLVNANEAAVGKAFRAMVEQG